MTRENEAWRERLGQTPAVPGASLGAALVLLGVAVVYFWPLVSGSQSLGGDYAAYYYPFAQTLARALRQGELPLWNPYIAAGYHHLANPQTQVFYLPGWVLALFASGGRLSYHATELFTLAHYPLAGLFTFMYVRRLGAPPLAALVSGLSFTLSGFLWAQGLHKSMVETAAWLPLVLWALAGLSRSPSLKNALWLALAGAMFFLGGFVPLVYISAPFLAAYALLGLSPGRAWDPGPLPKLGWMALGAVLALGLVAVQLVPTLEISPLSFRQEFDLGFATEDSIWPGYLLSALIPLAHRGGARSFSLDELHFYVGLVPLLLAGASIASPRRPGFFFWLLAVVLATLLALGEHTPLYGWFWHHLPGMKVIRAPGRFALLIDLGISVLAGLGAARLLARPKHETSSLAWLWGLGLALGLAGGLALQRIKQGSLDPAAFGLAPDLAGQLTTALVFWGLGLAVLGLYWVRSLPGGAVVAALAVLLVAQALTFPVNMMWSPRSPQSYFETTPPLRLMESQLPPGRLGIDLSGSGPDRHEFGNCGAVLALPTTSLFDSMVELRLWRAMDSPDRRVSADLLDERFLLTSKVPEDLPQALYHPFDLRAGQWANLDLGPLGLQPVGELSLVTHLGYAAATPQGQEVAELLVFGPDGLLLTAPLRAGVETAEWSAAKPGAAMAHAPAKVARSWPVDQGAYQGHSYRARWAFDPPQAVTRLQLRLKEPRIGLKVERVELNGSDLFTLGRRYVPVQGGLQANLFHLERARLLRSWRVVTGAEEAWGAIHLADLGREAVLEEEPVLPEAAPGEAPETDQVEIEAQGMNWVRVKVRAKAPALLLLADTWYPGWQAKVDGHPTRVLRADYFLRAVELGAGEHEVVFRYRPAWLPWAAGISLVSLGLWLGLGLAAWRGRGRRR
jgi:hypothetical protein